MSVERHISTTVLSRMALSALMMLQSVFMTRLLGPEGRGLMAKLQASQSFFVLLLGLGLTSGLTYFVASQKIELKRVLGIGFILWLAGVLVSVVSVAIFLTFPRTDIVFPTHFATQFYIFYFLASYALNSFQLFTNSALSGKQKFQLCNWLEIVVVLIRVGVFGFYFLGNKLGLATPSVITIFIWDLSAVAIRSLLFAIGYVQEFGFKIDIRIAQSVKPVVGFSILVWGTYLINFLYLRIDYWLIEWKVGLAALGIYSVASGLAQFVSLVPITLNSLMLPHLSEGEPNVVVQKFKLFSRLNAAAVFTLSMILILFASPLIRFFYGQAFQGAIFPLRIIGAGYLFASLKHLFVYYNVSQNRMRPNIEAELLGLFLGVCSNLILIPRMGTIGAAVSSLLANFFSCSYMLLGICSRSRLRVIDLLILSPDDFTALWRSLFQSNLKEPA